MLNIVIFGAPGSGKGTQSKLIVEKYGLYHISTGDILRKEIEEQTELGRIADEYISQGHLVPDDLIIEMLSDILKREQKKTGYIFDGFPRTLEQAKALDKMLQAHNTIITLTLALEVEEKELVQRILKRAEESGRKDDKLETVRERLNVYKERTEPLKDYYKKQGKLFKIKGHTTIEDVFADVASVIDRLI